MNAIMQILALSAQQAILVIHASVVLLDIMLLLEGFVIAVRMLILIV
jgi:hypothetical protein